MPGTEDKPAFARRFGKNLAECRKEKGLSQEELGFRAELHRTEVGMLERGIRIPRIDTLLKLACCLSVGVEVMFVGLHYTPRVASPGEFTVDDAKGGESP